MAKDPATTKRRGYGPRALAAVLPGAAKPALRARGFSAVEVITHWPEIVGPELAAATTPEKLSFARGARSLGTLHLVATGPVALELQHLEPMIVERVNTYFGYNAVARLALVQGPARAAPARTQRDRHPPPSRAEVADIDSRTQQLENASLRDALRRLGIAVAGSRQKPSEEP